MKTARIRIDYNNMMAHAVGAHGLEQSALAAMGPELEKIISRVEGKRGEMRWRALPGQDGIDGIIACAERVRQRFDNFVVLGIGGSALGPIAVHRALRHLRYNELSKERRGGPKLYVEDNVDPERMLSLLDVIDCEKTVFNVITKSGSTSETMSQLLIIVDLLKQKLGDEWPEHVIATTDREKGNLIKIAKQFALETFYVPDGVGGRFSELSPVGLLAAAVTGIDIKALLAGAGAMDEWCSAPQPEKNPACTLAALMVLAMRAGKNIHVMMPYADSLLYISDWYAQLWAESLGKRYDNAGNEVCTGQTPVKALGVTDQHSQVQLYVEGPYDKVVTFLGVDAYRQDCPIPHGFEDIPDVSFLGGHTLAELIKAEQSATEYALVRAGRPNFTITLPEVNAHTLGQLLFLLEMQTAYAGELLSINAFDQPGVEEGKNATYALLGKPGYDEKRREMEGRSPKSEKYILN